MVKSVKKEALRTYFENSIAVQKVLVRISEKLDNLTNQLTELLGLFEKASNAFSSQQGISERKIEETVIKEGREKSKEEDALINKLDSLIDQNKTIAKGLMLLEQKMRDESKF